MKKASNFWPSILFIAVFAFAWSVGAASPASASEDAFPNSRFLVDAAWLNQHQHDDHLVIVDVREDRAFDGRFIPGSIRMPWTLFYQNDPYVNMGGLFIGVLPAQMVLGQHGISRDDTIVLYDAIARDGGATASYVFWILDMLGHKNMAILESGIEAWAENGGEIVSEAAKREPGPYQAPAKEVDLSRKVDGQFIQSRLGDRYYQILDVRSAGEYSGRNSDSDLYGDALKPGHIPTAFNIPYQFNWKNSKTKAFRPYSKLRQMYKGLDPDRAVITYCHSGRRASFGYFVLRLMGFNDVRMYDASWFEWGSKSLFFPTETKANDLPGQVSPDADSESETK